MITCMMYMHKKICTKLQNLSLDPLPAYAFDFFFDDPAFIRRLMMPWCIINASVAQLFKWLWMRNKKFHKNFISAILCTSSLQKYLCIFNMCCIITEYLKYKPKSLAKYACLIIIADHISADMKTLEMLWHEVRYIADIVGNVGDEFGEDRIAYVYIYIITPLFLKRK